MQRFELFADSAANLSNEIVTARNVHMISYTCNVDGEERLCFDRDAPFRETAKKFYEDMRAGMDPKTSLIVEERFAEELVPALERGSDVVLITIAQGISGTYAQAVAAQKALLERYPARKIFVIDSANASLGEGLLVLRAADLRDEGKSAEECAAWLAENTYKLNSYVTVEDLKYLRRSGRISTVTAIAGALLNIKPLIRADGGSPAHLAVYGKAHGRRKALSAILEAFDQNVIDPQSQTVAIAHADCEAEAEEMAAALKARGAKEVIVDFYDLCSGSHIGPGTLAVFFFGKDRRGDAEEKRRGLFGKKK